MAQKCQPSFLPEDFPILARVRDVLPVSGYRSEAGLRLAVKAKRFPPPVRVGKAGVAWRRSDLEAYIANLTPAA